MRLISSFSILFFSGKQTIVILLYMQIVSKYTKGHNSFQIKVQIRKLF